MYELKKIGKLFTSKFVGNGPSSYKKLIYRAAVSQSLRNTVLGGKTKGAYFAIFRQISFLNSESLQVASSS